MRADVALAARRHEVRAAALGWERAGVIDEATRAKIALTYPDDRSRLGPVFRILAFGFTVMVVMALFGLSGPAIETAGEGAAATLCVLFGLALVGATEFQIGSLRRAQGGAESATAFLGLCFLVVGLFRLMARGNVGDDTLVNAGLIVSTLVLAAAAYRWGYAACFMGATTGVFLLLARSPIGRVSWVMVALTVAPFLMAASDSVRLPPAHRRGVEAIALVALVFLYLAVHVGSWDRSLVEMVTWHGLGVARSPSPIRPFLVVATALVPVAVLAWGIATRRRPLIDLALFGVLASIVTLRFYVHLAPLWVALLAGGAVAIGLALALRRCLDTGPQHERLGFTAEPLFGDPESQGAVELAASMATFSPGAPPLERPGFEGGGGQFGGGGATGTF